MSSQLSVKPSGYASVLSGWKLRITFAGYALLLLCAALSIPLRIPEILQIAASRDFSPAHFFGWIAQAPASAPLNYFVQLPLALAIGPSRLGARLVSVVFAVGACYLFLRLAKRIPLQRPYPALLLFMLLPVHFELSFQARPVEQALFLVVLATGYFFRLVFRPGVKNGLWYAGCLTLALYTDRDSFLPAIGYLLFLLRFVNRAQERRAIWYVLPATTVPVLLFLPYALWAHTRTNPDWLLGPPALQSGVLLLRALRSVAAERWASYLLCVLLTIGALAGIWTSFRVMAGGIGRRIRLFSLAGGVIVTVLLALALDVYLGERFASSQLLWTAPATVLLIFAAFEAAQAAMPQSPARKLRARAQLRPLAAAGAILLIAVACISDAQSLFAFSISPNREDVQALASAVPPQLEPDSCVVFVSEKFSKALFLVFEPQLNARECTDFFDRRIVLASHPYVRPDQQQDAESFFRGLNFVPTKRLAIGGGQIVVMQQAK